MNQNFVELFDFSQSDDFLTVSKIKDDLQKLRTHRRTYTNTQDIVDKPTKEKKY